MVEKIWFGNHPLKFVLWPLLWPLSQLFSYIVKSRRCAYQQGKKKAYKAPVPVIVVGNITAGGNGKTPVVIWLVEMLQELGFKPGVVSRGYGAKAEQYPLIVDDSTSTSHCGDEPKLIFKRTNAFVAVDPNRSKAVQALLPLGVDVIITDDGLQHYALQRDIELVVVDGQRRFGNQSPIPLGPLREPLSRLNDVDFIINNGGDAVFPEIKMTLAPSLAVNLVNGQRMPVSQLKGLVAMAGIGHPPRFFNTLEVLGAKPILAKGFADHQAFKADELIALAKQGQHLIMTEKDAVKCADYALDNWWYLPISASFEAKDEACILNRIKEVIESYGSSSA